MKQILKSIIMLLPIVLFVSSASAHDPKEHAKKPESANCAMTEKIKNDRISKGGAWDMTDSVVLAIMKKCSKNKTHGEQQPQHSEAKEPAKVEGDSSHH